MTNTFLSIVIPAHNEAKRLPPSLEKIDSFLSQQDFTYEVLVVENGSTDGTFEIAESFIEKMPYLRVIHEEQRGKGLAVKRGMLEAVGEYRFFCDADLSMPIEQVVRFIPPQLADVEVSIGSREIAGAHRIDEPGYRHLIGRVFNTIVRWMVLARTAGYPMWV